MRNLKLSLKHKESCSEGETDWASRHWLPPLQGSCPNDPTNNLRGFPREWTLLMICWEIYLKKYNAHLHLDLQVVETQPTKTHTWPVEGHPFFFLSSGFELAPAVLWCSGQKTPISCSLEVIDYCWSQKAGLELLGGLRVCLSMGSGSKVSTMQR